MPKNDIKQNLKISLLSMSKSEIADLLSDLPKYAASDIFQFLHNGKNFEQMTSISQKVRERLSDEYCAIPLKVEKVVTGRDGTKKYLFRLCDDNLVESVFMNNRYGNTLCVSTQVGCRMGCAFCASGMNGLVRNLTAGEILAQVILINSLEGGTTRARKVKNVVLMGSGEPLDNYDNTLKFLNLANEEGGINISARNISVSTSGLCDKIRALADSNLSPTLTISLHASNDIVRSELMAVNKKYPINEVISAAKYYFEKTGRRVIFEYSLIQSKNDKIQHADELTKLCRGFPCHINLIRLNAVRELKLKGSSVETAKAFLERLRLNGVSATIRRSLGGGIEGACGQLRRRYLSDEIEKAAKVPPPKTT